MAKKKTYYIPTIEILSFETRLMGDFPMAGSPSHGIPLGGAPKRFTPAF
jgi:hypothetical protein